MIYHMYYDSKLYWSEVWFRAYLFHRTKYSEHTSQEYADRDLKIFKAKEKEGEFEQ